MSFSICFTDEPNQHLGDDPSVPYALGRIVAGALDEGFASILYEWNRCDYEAQWTRSLRQLVAGDKKVVLITHYVNPTESSNLEWWALYRGDNVVYVQNHLRFYDQLGSSFSVAEVNQFLADRITVNEEGNQVSEWEVPLADITLFVNGIKQQNSDASP